MLARVFVVSHVLDTKVFANAVKHRDGHCLLYMGNNKMVSFYTEKICYYNRYQYFNGFVFPVYVKANE